MSSESEGPEGSDESEDEADSEADTPTNGRTAASTAASTAALAPALPTKPHGAMLATEADSAGSSSPGLFGFGWLFGG